MSEQPVLDIRQDQIRFRNMLLVGWFALAALVGSTVWVQLSVNSKSSLPHLAFAQLYSFWGWMLIIVAGMALIGVTLGYWIVMAGMALDRMGRDGRTPWWLCYSSRCAVVQLAVYLIRILYRVDATVGWTCPCPYHHPDN